MSRRFALLSALCFAAVFVAEDPALSVRSLGAGERTRPNILQLAKGQDADAGAKRAAAVDTVTTRRAGKGASSGGPQRLPAKSAPVITPLSPPAVDERDIAVTVRVVPSTAVASPVFALWQNVPNPSPGSTLIRYSLGRAAKVTITVYSVAGERVTTLVDDYLSAGEHTVQWNGIDDGGNLVRSGVYFYRMKSGSFVRNKKLVLHR